MISTEIPSRRRMYLSTSYEPSMAGTARRCLNKARRPRERAAPSGRRYAIVPAREKCRKGIAVGGCGQRGGGAGGAWPPAPPLSASGSRYGCWLSEVLADPLLRVPDDLGLRGSGPDVLDARVVTHDARVGEQRDAVQVLPQRALEDGALLVVDLRVHGAGEGVERLVDGLVGEAATVLRSVGAVDVATRGDLPGAGPREEGDLPRLTRTGEEPVGEVGAGGVDDVEAHLVALGLDHRDLVGATLVALGVGDAHVDRGLDAGGVDELLSGGEVGLVVLAVVGLRDDGLVVLLEREDLAGVHHHSLLVEGLDEVVDDALAGDAHGKGLTQLQAALVIGEDSGVEVEVQVLPGQGVPGLVGEAVVQRAQLLEGVHRGLRLDDVEVTVGQRLDLPVGLDEAEGQPRGSGRGAPVVLVGLEGHVLAGLPGAELVGAGDRD